MILMIFLYYKKLIFQYTAISFTIYTFITRIMPSYQKKVKSFTTFSFKNIKPRAWVKRDDEEAVESLIRLSSSGEKKETVVVNQEQSKKSTVVGLEGFGQETQTEPESIDIEVIDQYEDLLTSTTITQTTLCNLLKTNRIRFIAIKYGVLAYLIFTEIKCQTNNSREYKNATFIITNDSISIVPSHLHIVNELLRLKSQKDREGMQRRTIETYQLCCAHEKFKTPIKTISGLSDAYNTMIIKSKEIIRRAHICAHQRGSILCSPNAINNILLTRVPK